MKKIISVLLISAGLFGCRFQETETKSQNGYPVSSIFSPKVTFKSVEKNTQKPLAKKTEQSSKLQSKTTGLKPPAKDEVKVELASKKSQPTKTETKEEKIEVTEGDCGC